MVRTSLPARCAGHDLSGRDRLSWPDAVVIVVIAVLACVLNVHGLAPSSVWAVLAIAAVVATGTLAALRGGVRRLGHAAVRVANAVAAP
jgi:hypothetical protein